jgi:hypothetical protein
MTKFEITCIDKIEVKPGHEHVNQVGVASDHDRWFCPPAWVSDRFDEGHVFFALLGEGRASVRPYKCPGCGFATIRATPDDETADGLDRLPACIS